jgi:hypothetical protein
MEQNHQQTLSLKGIFFMPIRIACDKIALSISWNNAKIESHHFSTPPLSKKRIKNATFNASK